MELVLKNVSPKDYALISDLAHRRGIQVEEKPDHASIIDDLKEAIEEIQMVETGKSKLQNARDLINEF